MDVGWKRLHLLLCFLTFWKHAVGRESLGFQSFHPRSLHFQKANSPPEVQSSTLNASVTGNIPLEVDSNVLGGNGTSPGRSRFSYLQFVKGGAPSGYASMSQAQSASSSSVSTSITTPQNLSQPGSFSTLFSVQGSSTSSGNMAGQSVGGTGYNQYDSPSKDSTGLKAGGSSQLVSSTGGSGSSQSNSSQSAPGSFSALMYSPTVLSQAGSKSLNPSSQSSSGPHMGGITSWLFTSASQGSSRSPLTGSSSPHVSTQGGSASFSGLYQQSPSKSQSSPTYSSIGSLPLAVSRYPTSSQSLYSSGSQGSSYQFAASRPSGLAQGTSSQPGVSYVQSQGSLSQVAIGPPRYGSASLAAPQVPQKWLPSASSFSPGSQTSATALSQSSYSPQSAPAPSKPLSSVGLPSQVAPGLLSSSASMASPQSVLCQYDNAAGSVNTLSQHQPLQRLQPVSMSFPSIQTSSTVSQSSSLFKAVKTPSSFSPSSAGGPRPLVPMQGAGGSGGSAYIPGSSAYSKLVSSPLGAPSQFTSSQSSRDLSTSSLQSNVGTAQTVSSHYVSSQNRSTSTFGSSLQSQVASSQFGPAPSLDAKVPVYSQAPPVGTMYQSQPSLFWQPSTSKATDGSFSTSGAAVLQSSSSSQRVQAPTTSSSAGGASYPVSTQGSGSYSYSGLSLSPSTVLQYAPVSGMVGSPPLSVSSQSASGQSSPSQHTSLSQSRTGSLLTSSGSLSVPGGSGSSDGSSLLTQGTFCKDAPVPSMETRLPVFSQTKAVSSGVSLSQSQPLQSWQPSATGWRQVVQGSGSALQSGSPPQSVVTSGGITFLPALSTPVDSVAQSSQTSSLLGLGSRPARLPSIASSGSVSNQMSPGVSVSLKLPTGSMTPGSTAQAASVGMSSAPSQALGDSYGASVGGQGMSSGLKSVLYSSYGSSSSQSGPISYSQSAGGQSSPSQYASLSLSRTGSLLTPSGHLSVPGGSDSTGGTSLLAQGTFGKYTPVASMDTRFPVFSRTKTVSSGASLSQSQPLQSWQPSAVRWSDVQASGTAALQSGSSQSAQTSGSVSFLPASSTVDSVAQSSQTSSLLGFGSRPARLPSIASSGSVSNQMPPCVSASLKQPTGSMTPGSAAQGVSVSSQAQTPSDSYGAGGQGMSSGLKYMIQSSYGSSSQSGLVSYSPVSGSAGSQVSPGLFASLKLPTGSITRGSTAQPASGATSSPSQALGDPYGASVGGQGMSGSVSSGLTSVSSSYGSSYGQMDPASKASRGSLRRHYAVKG